MPHLSELVCQSFEDWDIDPLACIASGALLLCVEPEDSGQVCQALHDAGIHCVQIGGMESPQSSGEMDPSKALVWKQVHDRRVLLPRPERDEIARLYESLYNS